MNPQEDPRLLIVALRGLPITVAGMLCNYPQPVSQAHLCSVLCTSDKTMSIALSILQEFQMVSQSPEGWSVTIYVAQLGYQLPEWLQAADKTGEPVDTCPVDTYPVDTCPVNALPQEKGRKISDPNPLTTSSSIKLINKNLEKNLVLVDHGLKNKSKTEPELKPKPKPEKNPKSPEMIRECRQAAHESGIGEPKATSIAKLAHTTPEMIVQYVQAALAMGERVGLAIHWLEHDIDAKKPYQKGSSGLKTRDREDRQRYVTGEYADYINH